MLALLPPSQQVCGSSSNTAARSNGWGAVPSGAPCGGGSAEGATEAHVAFVPGQAPPAASSCGPLSGTAETKLPCACTHLPLSADAIQCHKVGRGYRNTQNRRPGPPPRQQQQKPTQRSEESVLAVQRMCPGVGCSCRTPVMSRNGTHAQAQQRFESLDPREVLLSQSERK